MGLEIMSARGAGNGCEEPRVRVSGWVVLRSGLNARTNRMHVRG